PLPSPTRTAICTLSLHDALPIYEIAKLIGSPPGYLSHRETHPLITQEELAKSHRGELKLSFVLFDEIEKASGALWQLLLGILDKDRKSTRLNSSHVSISYAVFCL